MTSETIRRRPGGTLAIIKLTERTRQNQKYVTAVGTNAVYANVRPFLLKVAREILTDIYELADDTTAFERWFARRHIDVTTSRATMVNGITPVRARP